MLEHKALVFIKIILNLMFFFVYSQIRFTLDCFLFVFNYFVTNIISAESIQSCLFLGLVFFMQKNTNLVYGFQLIVAGASLLFFFKIFNVIFFLNFLLIKFDSSLISFLCVQLRREYHSFCWVFF